LRPVFFIPLLQHRK